MLIYLLTIDIYTAAKGIGITPSQGVKYLLDQGAKIEQPRFIGVRVRRKEYPILLELLWKAWGGIIRLLSDEAYAVLKLIIEHGAAEGEVTRFLLPNGVQLDPSPRIKAGPFSSENYHIVVHRWDVLLDLMAHDQNFENGLSCEIDDHFFQFIMMIFCFTLNAGTRLPDPCPTEILHRYMDEAHPKTIEKFLEKGANINMKINRYDFHGSLLGTIYHRHAWGLNLLQRIRQLSFVSMLISLGAEPFIRAEEGGVHDTDPLQRQ